jgi:NAD-dependent dihydropyrimidine dehydrogenase PreA subunit
MKGRIIMDISKIKSVLENNKFIVRLFETGDQAADYLNDQIDGTSVAFGGMKTADDLGLYESLAEHNEVIWHWRQDPSEALEKAKNTEVYISSVNALSEDGYMVNIDSKGNRLSATLFGHKRVFLVIGVNKLVEGGLQEAIFRARNIAAPRRAAIMGKKTPCAVRQDKCYDCKSPDRICRGMAIMMQPMGGQETEIILVNEELGL